MWLFSGVAAFGAARIIPFLKERRWVAELLTAVVAGALSGLVATALDFGGWSELDWRAAVFAFTGAFAAIAVVRLTMARKPGGPS